MPPPLFDPDLAALRRARARRLGSDYFLHARALEDIVERIAATGRRFERALVLGLPPGSWRERLSRHVGTLAAADDIAGLEPRSFDLAVTIGELASTPDPRLHLFVLGQALRPGGMLAGAIVGAASLPALRTALLEGARATGRAALRVHPTIDGPAMARLLAEAGLANAVVDIDRVAVAYRSLGQLVGDLRAMGCTSVLADRSALSRAEWDAARAAFVAAGAPVSERFELIHFAGWARDAVASAALTSPPE